LNVYVKEPQQKAHACIIWMHGLGADAQDMAGLAEQLPLNVAVRHVFIDAPTRPVTVNNHMVMRAWYDIVGASLLDRQDREGIMQSEAIIHQVLASQLADGFLPGQVFLAGFSQGGAMALFAGLRANTALAGIISLSAYLPLASECTSKLDSNTPIFIASGLYDPVVSPVWTKLSADWLREHHFNNITSAEYPMQHAICVEEIQALGQWINTQVRAIDARQPKEAR